MDRDVERKLMGQMTLADHAEAWGQINKVPVPQRGTPEWREFYARWHSAAFAGFNRQENGDGEASSGTEDDRGVHPAGP
jgi:hypothetical protein